MNLSIIPCLNTHKNPQSKNPDRFQRVSFTMSNRQVGYLSIKKLPKKRANREYQDPWLSVHLTMDLALYGGDLGSQQVRPYPIGS